MKLPFSNLIVFAGIVDFGNACKIGNRKKQTDSTGNYLFNTQNSAVASSKNPPPRTAFAEKYVVVKYSNTADFVNNFVDCDEKAYLVKWRLNEKSTDIVRTKASCVQNILGTSLKFPRQATNLKVNVGGIDKDVVGKPIVHESYDGTPNSKYDIGLIQLRDSIDFHGPIVKESTADLTNWVVDNAKIVSAND